MGGFGNWDLGTIYSTRRGVANVNRASLLHQPKEPCSQSGSGMIISPTKGQIDSPASMAPPAKTLLSRGRAKVGRSRVFVQQPEHKQAASLARGVFALPADLSRPPPALPRQLLHAAAGASRDGQRLLPDVCGGFPAGKLQGGFCHPLGRDADGWAAVSQLAAVVGVHIIY